MMMLITARAPFFIPCKVRHDTRGSARVTSPAQIVVSQHWNGYKHVQQPQHTQNTVIVRVSTTRTPRGVLLIARPAQY